MDGPVSTAWVTLLFDVSDPITELRAELATEKRNTELLFQGIEARITALEQKQARDLAGLETRMTAVETAVRGTTNAVANLGDQVRASHYSVVHLLGITARAANAPKRELDEAMRLAKEAVP